jgi:hypothetical protein
MDIDYACQLCQVAQPPAARARWALGRFVICTKGAFTLLDDVYGTFEHRQHHSPLVVYNEDNRNVRAFRNLELINVR